MKAIRITVLTFAGVFLAFPAHAYVDFGSGSLLLQFLAAIGVGVLFYFRQGVEVVKGWFKRGSDGVSASEKPSNDGDH